MGHGCAAPTRKPVSSWDGIVPASSDRPFCYSKPTPAKVDFTSIRPTSLSTWSPLDADVVSSHKGRRRAIGSVRRRRRAPRPGSDVSLIHALPLPPIAGPGVYNEKVDLTVDGVSSAAPHTRSASAWLCSPVGGRQRMANHLGVKSGRSRLPADLADTVLQLPPRFRSA